MYPGILRLRLVDIEEGRGAHPQLQVYQSSCRTDWVGAIKIIIIIISGK